jgi:hypothetical protein
VQTNGSGKYQYYPISSYTYITNKTYTYETAYTYSYSTNYSYTYTTNLSYTYPNLSYTYETAYAYTYPQYTYTYDVTTYNYVIYQGVPSYTTNHYDHVLTTGDYYTTQPLSGTTYVSGNARLVMPNGLSMSGNDKVTIDPTSGKLRLYSGGTDLTIGGNGIINAGGYADHLMVYAALSVTSITLNGNGEFTGVLVAPNANIRMNGGGHADNDFIGSLMVNSVTMNGHFKFHYDEALSRLGGSSRFLITSWDEIP